MNGEFSHIVPASAHGSRLDAFAAAVLGCSVRAAKRLVAEGRVLANGKTRPPHFKLETGTVVAIALVFAEAGSPPIRIAAAGPAYMAFIKPAGLHTAAIANKASPSLERALREQWPTLCRAPVFEPLPWMPEPLGIALGGHVSPLPPFPETLPPEPPVLLSRLDTLTSGLVTAAFTAQAAAAFRSMEAAGKVAKYYLAVVHGTVTHPLSLENALDTDNRKKTRVLPEKDPDTTRHTAVYPLHPEWLGIPAPQPGKTLIAAHIRRGARHQIRAHLAHAGLPILGDPLYGIDTDTLPLYLHHARIVFPGFAAACLPSWLRTAEKSRSKSCLCPD